MTFSPFFPDELFRSPSSLSMESDNSVINEAKKSSSPDSSVCLLLDPPLELESAGGSGVSKLSDSSDIKLLKKSSSSPDPELEPIWASFENRSQSPSPETASATVSASLLFLSFLCSLPDFHLPSLLNVAASSPASQEVRSLIPHWSPFFCCCSARRSSRNCLQFCSSSAVSCSVLPNKSLLPLSPRLTLSWRLFLSPLPPPNSRVFLLSSRSLGFFPILISKSS